MSAITVKNLSLPPDGVYRTSAALPGKERYVKKGVLVYFQQASGDGETPIILLPETNVHNRWKYKRKGYLVRDGRYLDSLEALLSEGYYTTTEPMILSRSDTLPEGTLVQLGYNREGDPILFPARFEANRIIFPTRGKRFETREIFDLLIPAGFQAPDAEDYLV